MALIIAQFLGVIAPDMLPPSNMQELIPYLFVILIGALLVSAVLKVISSIVSGVFFMGRM